MSTIGGANIVREGLVLYLDAANQKSYLSGSTVWRDLSLNNNSGSLVNGPTFDSTNMGSIVFDGTNDYVLINSGSTLINPTTAITVASFFNAVSYSSNFGPIVFKQNNYSGTFEQYSLSFFNSTMYFVVTGIDRLQKIVSGSQNYDNQPIYVVGICDTITDELKLYINGTLIHTNLFTSTFDIADTPINIGGTGVLKFSANYPGWLNGKIYTTQIYNRALTATEVLQNYEALKSRYI